MSALVDTPETPATPVAPPRPTAFFLMAPTRRMGPLTRDELVRYMGAGLVDADALIVGPEWDGAFSAAAAAEWFGVALSGPGAATGGPRAPVASSPGPIGYRRAGLDWRVATLWILALLAVQMAIVPARSIAGQPDLAGFVGAVAWRFALVALPCWLVVAGTWRVARGLWPSARAPLFATSAVYIVLAVQFLLQPPPPAPRAVVSALPAMQDEAAPVVAGEDPFDAWQREAFADADADAPADDPGAAADTPQPPVTSPARAAKANVARGPRVDPDPLHTTARALFGARDWQGLLAHATTWTRQEPQRAYAWLYLGLAHEYLGNHQEALAAKLRAHELDPGDVVNARNLAITLSSLGRHREVTEVLEPVLARHPDDYRAFNSYGYAMMQLGEFDQAVEALERAIEIEPGYTRAWQNLSDTYQRAGYLAKAREISRRANARR